MKIPILFVCEDNGFAVHTPVSQRQGYKSITEIISRFNCNVFQDEPTDVEAIYNLTLKAIDLTNKTHIPSFLYLRYYRYLEHVGVNEDFDAGYRSREEFEKWYHLDQVNLQRKKLLQKGIEEAELTAIEAEIKRHIENSMKSAKEAPFPETSELLNGVFD
jgi:pyruvate dehydrogenase E1 component alpha subunit